MVRETHRSCRPGLRKLLIISLARDGGLDEIRMLFDVLHQPVLIFAHAEEVAFLLRCAPRDGRSPGRLCRPSAGVSVQKDSQGVQYRPLVLALVDVALLVELAGKSSARPFRGSSSVVRMKSSYADVPSASTDPWSLADDFVHILLGGDAGSLGLTLDLLAVLVGAGAENRYRSPASS